MLDFECRFQITWLYLPEIPDPTTWHKPEFDSKPPIYVRRFMMDLAHCSHKDGKSVLAVINRQLSRVNIQQGDIMAGNGDGGGENEGHGACVGFHCRVSQ